MPLWGGSKHGGLPHGASLQDASMGLLARPPALMPVSDVRNRAPRGRGARGATYGGEI